MSSSWVGREQDRVVADFLCHRGLFDNFSRGGRIGTGDQYFTGFGKILDELENVAALLCRLAEVFARRSVRHPASHSRITKMDKELLKGLEIDLAVSIERGNESGHDA